MFDRLLFRRHLEDDEEVKLIVHRHWIFGVKTLFLPMIVFFALWILLFYIPNKYMFWIVGSLEFATIIWGLRNFFDYYLDVWIITDEGIIDLAWHGWFHRESSRVLYSDIQGLSYEIQGIVGTLFRYGVISAEKISSGSVISLPDVQHPRHIETIILDCMEEYLHTKNLKDAATVQELLAEFVAGSMQKKDIAYEEEDNDDEEEEEEVVQKRSRKKKKKDKKVKA